MTLAVPGTESSPSTGATILVVDDSPVNLRLVVRTLEGRGYRLLAAKNGRAALDIARRVHPDLILLDVMMPKVDGWEMLRRVHERHGVGSIPVIMFSGKVEEESMRAATSRGAQGFIGKPFNPQQLIESTKQLVPA
jgi:two-component system, LuxR family, sensor kinase FixL